MKTLVSTIAFMLCASFAFAQAELNPRLIIVEPSETGKYNGRFVLEVHNFEFQPELAGPVSQFGNGLNGLGLPIVPGAGHTHGWIFDMERRRERGSGIVLDMIRTDGDVPAASDYVTFFGANGYEWHPDHTINGGYIIRNVDLSHLGKGMYKAFWALQHDDHTSLIQATAPAMQPIDSVIFQIK